LSLPRKRSTALRRIEIGSAARAASLYGFRHTDGDASLADPADAIAGGEIYGVDAAVALSAALGAYLGGGSPDARAVRAGVTIACSVGGLVLFDLIDVDGNRVAVGGDYALDDDIDHIVVGRPDRIHAGEGAAAIWRLIGGRGKDIGRALIGAHRAIIKNRADHDRLPDDRHRGAEVVTFTRVRGLQLLLLREGRVDRHRIDRSLIRHLDSDLISGELHSRLDLSPRRVERMQLVIAQPCSSSCAIQQDRLPTLPQSRLQISAQLQPQIQLLSSPSLSGSLRDRESLLQPARPVHIPFPERAAVTVAESEL
jgi:hypothetical protein